MRPPWKVSISLAAALLAACETPADTPMEVPAVAFDIVGYDCAAQSSVPEAECDALVTLYNSTGGDNWTTNTNWGVGDPCLWYGVTCADGSVTRLTLFNNHLTGSIPAGLVNLQQLNELILGYNQLSGSIPTGLGSISGLALLELNHNQLSGSIPAQFGALPELWVLDLSHNQLTGTIPPELGNLSNLADLSIYQNQLEGSIPPELANLGNLTWFLLFSNQLAGLVPLSVAQLGGSVPSCDFSANAGLYMPDTQAYRNADVDADGSICSVPLSTTPETVANDITSMIADLETSGMVNHGQANSLGNQIDQAMKLLQKGHPKAALNVVDAFIAHVTDLSATGVLDASDAEALIDQANVLKDLIDGG